MGDISTGGIVYPPKVVVVQAGEVPVLEAVAEERLAPVASAAFGI